jgi:hypothetical protein
MHQEMVRLWRAVLIQAVNDARLDVENGNQHGALWHYNWAQGRDCKLICDYAGIDHDCVVKGFKSILEGGPRRFNYKRGRSVKRKQ